MACAYGVEPVVDKLINNGANIDTVNCYGYSPLLEACHRGYLGIIEKLIKAGANLEYIPDTKKSYSSPFQAAPPHCALGESARCGYARIVALILESNVDKDQVNELSWC
jgi:ankyrin repeat protein